MRIAIFVHCFFPAHFYGTETYTLELARNLRQMGHEAIVVSAVFPGERRQERLVSYYEYEGLPVYSLDKNYLPHTSVKDTYYQPALRDTLRQLIKELHPDLIHVAHLINHTAALLEVASELGIPTVATFTDFFGFCFNNKLEAADGSLCRGPNRKRTNCVACLLKARAQQPRAGLAERVAGRYPFSRLSAAALDQVIRVPGFRQGPLAGFVRDVTCRPDTLLHWYSHYRAAIAPTKFLREAYTSNGLKIPIHRVPFGVEIARERKPRRAPRETLRFGFIGQIAPHKGTHVLMNAFRQLPPSSRAELHIFGPEDQEAGYVTRLRRLAVDGRVHFRGTFPKEQMAHVFSELDFLVIPSTWYENSPLVLLYALASHTPVVVSDVPGMTEFVEPGQNGYAFRRGSVRDLAGVLRHIVQDPERAREMAATTHYERTPSAVARDVVEVYGSILCRQV